MLLVGHNNQLQSGSIWGQGYNGQLSLSWSLSQRGDVLLYVCYTAYRLQLPTQGPECRATVTLVSYFSCLGLECPGNLSPDRINLSN